MALQEKIHLLQLEQRRNKVNKDILLLLQHRPVYTAGRRQKSFDVRAEQALIELTGADCLKANRGGELTYHGPGQIVGYPLFDLCHYYPTMGARDFVCHMQKALERYLKDAHGIDVSPSENTGLFLNSRTKIGSIGVQIRHRLTLHGFALNLTREPCSWFENIVACGLKGVKAISVEDVVGRPIRVEDEIKELVKVFGQLYGRDIIPLNTRDEGEIGVAIKDAEAFAAGCGPTLKEPRATG